MRTYRSEHRGNRLVRGPGEAGGAGDARVLCTWKAWGARSLWFVGAPWRSRCLASFSWAPTRGRNPLPGPMSFFRRVKAGAAVLMLAALACAPAALAEQYGLPLFVSETAQGQRGVLRVQSLLDESGTVEVYAIDDSGVRTGPATFTLDAMAAAEFDAADLVSGNAGKGLTGGLGGLSGDVRLEIDTELQVELLVHLRSSDGTHAVLHDEVRAEALADGAGHRYRVPTFNPAHNMAQLSKLRLINPGDGAAMVTVGGRDDTGAGAAGGTVQLTLAAGGATTLTAQQLEAGDDGLTGLLGAGSGQWRLLVTSDRLIRVVNLVTSSTGELGNLSTTGLKGVAPADHAAFNARFGDIAVNAETEGLRSRFTFSTMAGDGFTEVVESTGVTDTYRGSYAYERTGEDAGRLTLAYDDGDRCAANLYFSSRTGGWYASRCTGTEDPDGVWRGGSWSAADDGEPPPVDTSPVLPAPGGPGNQTYTVGTAIATLTLPAASGGDGTLTYSLSPNVPGLSFNATTRQLTGTPTAAGTYGMTYTATDDDGDTDTLGFSITVAAMDDSEPSFGTTMIADQTYTSGTAIDALTLPEASGGDGTLTYSLSPSVPGLSFDAMTRRLTGTPTTAGTHAMTYTVTDTDGDSDTVSFGITVEESDGGTPGANEGDCEVGLLVSPGGSCTYPGTTDAFTVDQDGRARFLVISSTRAINVNSVTFMGRFYDFRASHQGDGVWRIDRLAGSTTPTTGGGTDTDTSPAFPATGGPGDQTYTADTAIAALTLPAATGGDGTLSYSLSPSVPGLSFDAMTRRLTGTPTAAGPLAMTYTVTDEDGDTDSLSFTITVEDGGVSGSPDLVVQSPSVGDASPQPGASITFSATVRNQGAGQAAATTLRYYRSTDATISTADTEVGTDAVGSLAAAASSDESISLTTPSTTGTYYYGVCVDPVSGESDTGNNCSSAVRVTVSDSGASESFDLDAENNHARGIAYAAGRLFAVGYFNRRVFSYQTSGQRDSASDFNPDSDNFSPEGITFANGRFYVVDSNFGRNIDKVYVYQASGQREPAFDFNLPSANGWPGGITLANDRFYVVDKIDRKVYAYGVSAQRDAAFDFDLDSANRDPVGITLANQRFYVVDDGDGKVYAYHASGQRDSASDFDLDSDNGNAQGITFANDRFYVVDEGDGDDGKVYVYDGPTQSGGGGSDTLPSFGTATVDHQSYDAGTAIATLTLPAATGGDGTLSYSLSPSVPGLAFDAATRRLTGTPTTAGTHAMTYVVTDSDDDTATLGFTITVRQSSGGPIVTGRITECSGTRLFGGNDVLVTIRGIVEAHRDVSSVWITGTANGTVVRRIPLGSISAGNSETYIIVGTITTFLPTLRCTATAEYSYSIAGNSGLDGTLEKGKLFIE